MGSEVDIREESKITPKLVNEITNLKNERGLILAKDVVEYARPSDSPLHKYFCWDDSDAAERYRLMQASTLIRACVTYLPASDTLVRAFVSLRDDRLLDGGYRPIVEVLRNVDYHAKLVQDALFELHVFEEKYRRISELEPVFRAKKDVEKKLGKKK
jgi:hypothetical protein